MSAPANGRTDLVQRLNDAFAALAGWSFDHRFVVLALALAMIVGMGWLAAGVQIDNSYEAYFDPEDPTFTAYEQYRDDFGSDEISYLLYDAPGRPHGAFDLEVMRAVRSLTDALRDEVHFVYDVRSLTNAELITGVDDGIEIEKLEDDFPETQAELLARRALFLSKPMIVDGLVSADGAYGAVIIEMDRSSTDPPEVICIPQPGRGDAQTATGFDPATGDLLPGEPADAEHCADLENLYPQATDREIAEILARPEYAQLRVFHSGDVPLNAYFNRVIGSETARLQAITTALIAFILLVFFRSVVGVVGPVVVVMLSSLSVVAFIAIMGWKLDMSFSAIPTLITAIAVAHSVHILSEFRGRFSVLGDRRAALVETIRLVGTPSLLTSLTTAAGFGSMSMTPIKSIAHSGVYSAFGVIAAFVLSLTVLMALLSFGRSSPKHAAGAAGEAPARDAFGRRMHRFLVWNAGFVIRHRRAILIVSVFVWIGCLTGIARITVDSNWLDDFREGHPLRIATDQVDAVMGGTTNIIYLFQAQDTDGIKDPAALLEIERVDSWIRTHDATVTKTYSLVDVVKDLNQAFHADDPTYWAIPESRELVAQYLLLYEMSGGDETEKLVSPDYRRASLEVRLRMKPTSELATIVRDVDARLEQRPLEHTTVALTGIGALWLKLMDYIVSSQIEGFAIAFTVIAGMMIAVFGSWRVGLISMIPNLAPVFVALSAIGWLDLTLDYAKVSIAGVAMGIAVDDTIHLVSRFRNEFRRCGRYAQALIAAMDDVGRALIITSVALVAGMLVSTGSVLQSTAMQGWLLASTIVVALIADFLLMPALILTFEPFGPEDAQLEVSANLRTAA